MQSLEKQRPTVSFYKLPPVQGEISQDEFENYALERLKILSVLETCQGSEIYGKLENLVAKSHLNLFSEDSFRKDLISHWVLRLAFSKNEDLRNRLIQFECLLFKYRFEKQSSAQTQEFMKENDVNFVVFLKFLV